jgi:hypothetical protein
MDNLGFGSPPKPQELNEIDILIMINIANIFFVKLIRKLL